MSSSRAFISFDLASPVIFYHFHILCHLLLLTFVQVMASRCPWMPSPAGTYQVVVLGYAPGLLWVTHAEPAVFEAHIIANCAEHMQSHRQDDYYRPCIVSRAACQSNQRNRSTSSNSMNPGLFGLNFQRSRMSTTMQCVMGMGYAFPRFYTTSKSRRKHSS